MSVLTRTVIGLLLAFGLVSTWAQSLEVIELKYRTAEEVIPILQPLVEPGGALSGRDYTLFVRSGATNLAQLRAAVAQVDRKPRQLLISVRKGTVEEIEREALSASGTVRSSHAAASVNEPPSARSGVTVRGTSTNEGSTGGAISSVSVLEGSSAFISAGTSVPIVTSAAARTGRRAWTGVSTEYRDLTSGFLVTPRVNGEIVLLDIEQRDERVRNGTLQNQNLATQVSARVGEWTRLAGIDETATSTQHGVLSRRYSTSSQSQGVWVKVDVQ
jgi:type II secretory pathway component GspD/PulD (secretin)